MKILLINKFHYNRGGSETYYFSQAEALKAKGHEVIFFAMEDEKNIPCAQEKYFVPNVDYNGQSGIRSKIKAMTSFFYNKVAAENMERLINDEHPDIVHIGLINRQITFSVIEILKKYNIPVVMTMHDLIFACPNYTMLAQGCICEDCLSGSVINCVKKKCVKNSIAKSVLAAAEKKYLLKKKYYDLVDLYITECDFYKKLLIKSNVTRSKVITMSNFLPVQQKYGFEEIYGDYILFFGRFSREKGILTLLKAQKRLNGKYPLKLIGSGPLDFEIKNYISANKVNNVELPGSIYGDKMEKIIEKARVIIVPSEWYENCPYALLQSLAKGKIVIASRIGGLPELIEDGKTGFLFNAGDVTDLISKIEYVYNMDKKDYYNMAVRIAAGARKKHYWENYIDKLITEYERLISKNCWND